MSEITEQDFDDLTEGYKKSKPKIWKEVYKPSEDQLITDAFLKYDDIPRIAKQFKMTTTQMQERLSKIGLL